MLAKRVATRYRGSAGGEEDNDNNNNNVVLRIGNSNENNNNNTRENAQHIYTMHHVHFYIA